MNRKEINRMRLLAGLPLLENKTALNEASPQSDKDKGNFFYNKTVAKNKQLPSPPKEIKVAEDAVEYKDMPELQIARAARMAAYTTYKPDGEGGVILSGDVNLGLNVYLADNEINVFVHHGYYPDPEDEVVLVIKSIFDAAKEYWDIPEAKGELSAQNDRSAGGWAEVARRAGMSYSAG